MKEIQKTQISKSSSRYRNIALLAIFVLAIILIHLFWYPILQEKTSKLEKHNQDVRRITISNMRLEIPRSFLIGSSALKKDGEDESALLAFTYPEIKGGIGDGKDFILLFCEDLREYFSQTEVTHTQHLYNKYWDDFLDIDKDVDVYKIKYKNFDLDLKRKHYKIEDYGSKRDVEKIIKGMKENPGLSAENEISFRKAMAKQNEKFKKRLNGEAKPHLKHVYTNDDPKNPREFIVCETRHKHSNASCDSAFFYDDLFIELHFSRKSLNEFNDIKEQTVQLIKKWKQI